MIDVREMQILEEYIKSARIGIIYTIWSCFFIVAEYRKYA